MRQGASEMGRLDFDYSYELDERPYGETYGIGVRTAPDINDVEDFAVLLFRRKREGTLLEIARIDNTEHPSDDEAGPHIHRWYRETEMHERDYDIGVSTWHEADRFLEERAARFAKRYKTNHGERQVADGG